MLLISQVNSAWPSLRG